MFFSVRRDPKAGSAGAGTRQRRLECGIRGKAGRTERVLSKVVSFKMRLEERAHLAVSRSGVVEDEEVKLEGEGVDAERNNDEAKDACNPVADVGAL
jgi:hypothetical protein